MVLVVVNHCVFEDLFSSVSQRFFGMAESNHNANHLGSGSKHSHENEGAPHEHGQPHVAVIVVKSERVGFDALKIVTEFFPLLIVGILILGACILEVSGRLIRVQFLDDIPDRIHALTRALTTAPQAPPFFTA